MTNRRNYEWPQAPEWDGFFTQDKPGGMTQRVNPALVKDHLKVAGFLTQNLNHVTMDTTPESVPTQVGAVSWNADESTLDIQQPYGVTLQVGQEVQIHVVNKSGAAIPNGAPVYISGAQGNRPSVALAEAGVLAHAQLVAIATMDIADNAEGFVTRVGLVRQLNTSGFAEGAALYLSDTPGVLTAVAPTSRKIRVAYCVRSHATVGSVLVAIAELHPASDGVAFVPQDFGARGDGVSDDTLALQACISAAQDAGTGVRLPAASYLISGTLVISTTGRHTRFKLSGDAGGLSKIILAEGHSVPAIWLQGGNTEVCHLTLEDPTAYDSVRDPWRVGIEVGTPAAWNCPFNSIHHITTSGFYDGVHVALEMDNSEIHHIIAEYYTNAGVSLDRNRGYGAIGGLTVSSLLSISDICAGSQHPQWRPIKVDQSGTISHDRYGLILHQIGESSVSSLMLNHSVVPIDLREQVRVDISHVLIEPTYFTQKVFSGSSLVVAVGDVVEFPAGSGTPYLYRAGTSGTLTTKTGWDQTPGSTFVVDGVTLLTVEAPTAIRSSTSGYQSLVISDARLGRKTNINTWGSNRFVLQGCSEFGGATYSVVIGDQSAVLALGCNFPSSVLRFTGSNRFFKAIASVLPPVSNALRYTMDTNPIEFITTLSESATISLDTTCVLDRVYLLAGSAAQTITVQAPALYTDADMFNRGKRLVFTKTSAFGPSITIAFSGKTVSLSSFGDSVTLLYATGVYVIVASHIERKRFASTTGVAAGFRIGTLVVDTSNPYDRSHVLLRVTRVANGALPYASAVLRLFACSGGVTFESCDFSGWSGATCNIVQVNHLVAGAGTVDYYMDTGFTLDSNFTVDVLQDELQKFTEAPLAGLPTTSDATTYPPSQHSSARGSGPTVARPTLHMGDVGTLYFDTSLGYPIWWTGAAWVDSAGAAR